MPNFEARFTAGTAVTAWDDPGSLERPSRLNPAKGHPFLRVVATVGVEVEVSAYVMGLGLAPLDAAVTPDPLWSPLEIVEHPMPGRPVASSPAGQTSVQRFTPTVAGHYTLRFLRPLGGAVRLHIDAQDPPP